MYTLEVYSSIVWGGVIRCRESQSRVFYPSEVDDEFFSDRGFENVPSDITSNRSLSLSSSIITDINCWLHGWNFTTELYRILEHAMDDFHRRRPQNIGLFSPGDLFLKNAPSQSMVLNKVIAMHAEVPDIFKETRSVSSNTIEDRFSFQAANIAATVQVGNSLHISSHNAYVDKACSNDPLYGRGCHCVSEMYYCPRAT